MREHGTCLNVIFVVLLAVGCSADPERASNQSALREGFSQYRLLPHYRAFAVTGGSMEDPSATFGYSSAPSIDLATSRALEQCRVEGSDPAEQQCAIYSIGDLVIGGRDEEIFKLSKCIYTLDITANSIENSRYTAPCATMRKKTMHEFPDQETVLTETQIKAELVGNTLLAEGNNSIALYIDPIGASRVRFEGGQDSGSWRINDDGDYCSKWSRIRNGREVCNPIIRHGNLYKSSVYEYSLIEGNPFDL